MDQFVVLIVEQSRIHRRFCVVLVADFVADFRRGLCIARIGCPRANPDVGPIDQCGILTRRLKAFNWRWRKTIVD